jgi:hypothetical protein
MFMAVLSRLYYGVLSKLSCPIKHKSEESVKFVVVIVLYPGKGECADPVNEGAILEKEGGGEPHSRNRERQLASDTGGDKT